MKGLQKVGNHNNAVLLRFPNGIITMVYCWGSQMDWCGFHVIVLDSVYDIDTPLEFFNSTFLCFPLWWNKMTDRLYHVDEFILQHSKCLCSCALAENKHVRSACSGPEEEKDYTSGSFFKLFHVAEVGFLSI